VGAEGESWFVVNARDARWFHSEELGSYCRFEGSSGSGARFEQLGINVNVLQPGQSSGLYHTENAQEDFLVLSGECLLLVEGEERTLHAWDFFHCPPETEHILVGAGSGPCVFIAVGARPKPHTVRYKVSEVAARHGVSPQRETTSPRAAYRHMPPMAQGPYRDGDLPP
jgi:uncharacterized cupin superfamily protein